MIENIEQAKKHLKEIVDFYKLNDENNYDYSDDVLISIRIVLEEIERLNKARKTDIEYNKYLQKEIIRLNNIINNAIKGIEDYYYGDEEYKKYDYTLAYQIYHILKGEGKE